VGEGRGVVRSQGGLSGAKQGARLAAKKSAGILLYRRRHGRLEVLLAHPGGPFWKGKDLGAWTIPKGEIAEGEDPFAAAKREFIEETGLQPGERAIALTALRQPSGKQIFAWAIEGDCDVAAIRSNLFSMQWPPKSGKLEEFPEIDKAAWFPIPEAKAKILQGQAPFLSELESLLP
jgi:predicted NUDIX family NTP pyrophosphohydrolase